MKNRKAYFLLIVFILAGNYCLFSQNQNPIVSNVTFTQRTDGTGIVDIYYNINDSDGNQVTVTMRVSSDNGNTWNLSCNNISGDVGDNITSGTGKHIVWDFVSEHENYFSNQIRIKIIGDDKVPEPPVLVSPINNAPNISVEPMMIWNASSGAESYSIEVSTNNLFSNIVYSQSGIAGTSHKVTGLSGNLTYYWRVKSGNSYGTSNWSDGWYFTTTGSAPAAPVLISPANNNSDIPTTIDLIWNTVIGATNYTLQVSTDSSFSNLIYNQSGLTNNINQISGLISNTKYYWRVRATNVFGTSNWSSVYNFSTVGATPQPPVLVSPIHNATSVSTAPILIWNRSNGTTSYNLQVSTGLAFSDLVVNQSQISDTSQQITGLNGNTSYFWRVSAVNNYGTSNWSNVFTFGTTGTAPIQPNLVSPANNATGVTIPLTLSWNPSNGAMSYTLQVSSSNTFSSLIYNQSGLISTNQQLTQLNYSSKYYWRVSATNIYGTSGWSEIWNFTTSGPPFVCGTQLNYSGKNYNTIQIGNQCWFQENLNVGIMIQNTTSGNLPQNNLTIEKYCYNNNPSICDSRGGLYNWEEAMQYSTISGSQGICPTGWRVPTKGDFETLIASVSSNGNALKAVGQGTGSGAGTNASNFTAFLAGAGYWGGSFDGINVHGTFWTSTAWGSTGQAYTINLYNNNNEIYIGASAGDLNFYSIRCIKE